MVTLVLFIGENPYVIPINPDIFNTYARAYIRSATNKQCLCSAWYYCIQLSVLYIAVLLFTTEEINVDEFQKHKKNVERIDRKQGIHIDYVEMGLHNATQGWNALKSKEKSLSHAEKRDMTSAVQWLVYT